MKSIIAVPLLAFAQIAAVEGLANFLPGGFNGWWWQSSLTVGDRLYIDGGEVYSLTQPGFYGQTIVVDLSSNWTTSDVQGKTYLRNTSFVSARRPQLYYDQFHDIVYSEGGQGYGYLSSPPNLFTYTAPEVWGFKPDASADGTVTWTEKYSKELSASAYPYVSNVENALQTSSDTKHFSLGGSIGFLFNASDPNSRGEIALAQFLIYDYQTQTFQNKTIPSYYVDGEAQYVPSFGEEGVVIFFAGKTPVDRNVASDDYIADTGIILVYDIHNDVFYNQTASNAPVGRYNLCSSGAGNVQNSSYEIFMYSGTTDKNTTNNAVEMSKVLILSLPSFHWTEAPVPADTWRTSHTCQSIGPSSISKYNQRQMVSIGGDMSPSPNGVSGVDAVDPWTSGMKVFDKTTLTWSDNYNANAAPYERPDIINQYYASNSGYPDSWDDPALEAIFKTSRSLIVKPSSTGPSGSSSTSPSSGSSGSGSGSGGSSGADGSGTAAPGTTGKKSTNVGAIAGGVVGGIVALALIGLAVFFWRRRRPAKADDFGPRPAYVHGPAEMPVGYKDEPKLEMPGNGEHYNYRSELP